jgi:hypothetical protein
MRDRRQTSEVCGAELRGSSDAAMMQATDFGDRDESRQALAEQSTVPSWHEQRSARHSELNPLSLENPRGN